MQIVIDIDENVFTRLFDNGIEDYEIVNDDLFAIAKSIRKGKPLDAVFDEIRAEITELDGMYVIRDNAIYAEKIPKYERLWYVRLGEVIDILDKYKAESEGSDADSD